MLPPKSEKQIELEEQIAELRAELSDMRLTRKRYSHFATQMREVVEAAGGRMTKEDYLKILNQRIADDGGSTSVEVLRKTALRTPTMQRANICKVVIAGEYQVWLAEAGDALLAGDFYQVVASLDKAGGGA